MSEKNTDDSTGHCVVCGISKEKDNNQGASVPVGNSTYLYVCKEHVESFRMGAKWNQALTNNKADELFMQVISEMAAAHNADVQRGSANRYKEVSDKYEDSLYKISNFNLTPSDIYKELSKSVVGQSDAKKTLSTSIRSHYKKIQAKMLIEEGVVPEINPDLILKENILLIGPTGCGKTHICQTMSEVINVPFWKASLTSFTEAGYVGSSVEDFLISLIRASNNLVPLAERGILFLDEFDKKARKTTVADRRDVSGEGVQTALLEMLDTKGSVIDINIPGRGRGADGVVVRFDTSDVFFILGGAFVGLSDIISKRIHSDKKLGFGAINVQDKRDEIMKEMDLLHQVCPEDLVEYGFIPEIIGRIGCISVLNPLTKDELKSIMIDVEDSIVSQYYERAKSEDFKLTIDDSAIDAVCDHAYKSGFGARQLKSIIHKMLSNIFYEMPDRVRRRKTMPRVYVTKDTFLDNRNYKVN